MPVKITPRIHWLSIPGKNMDAITARIFSQLFMVQRFMAPNHGDSKTPMIAATTWATPTPAVKAAGVSDKVPPMQKRCLKN